MQDNWVQFGSALVTTLVGFMAKAGKNVSDTSRMHAFWEGVLDGLSGPLLMSLKLKVPMPSKGKDDSRELVAGLSHNSDLNAVSIRLSVTMHKALAEVAAARGIALDEIKVRELDWDGKLREVSRLKARQLTKENGGSSEQP